MPALEPCDTGYKSMFYFKWPGTQVKLFFKKATSHYF